ncbi:MAG: SpoIIE family protein phosphatase [Clostridium sp.]|jgi:sigma-B regulation protein RsbU (phosphoserine phosphatase)|nr:SpoIIE family protein phosphatase [Clostridium sp.]
MFQSIRRKVLTVLLLTALLPIAALGGLSLRSMRRMGESAIGANGSMAATAASDSRDALIRRIRDEMSATVSDKAALTNEKLKAIQDHTRIVAAYVSRLYAEPHSFLPRMLDYLQPGQENTSIAHIRTAPGVDYADIAGELSLLGNAQDVLGQYLLTKIGATASYIGTESGFFVTVDTRAGVPNRRDYDARTRDWYIGAKEEGGLFWTDVFADASGRGAAVSCAMPIYAPNGTLKAVAGTGAILNDVSRIIAGVDLGETGYAFLLNGDGQIFLTPKGIELDQNGQIIVRDLLSDVDEAVRGLGRAMIAGESGIREFMLDGRDVYVAYCPVQMMGWSMGLVMPAEEVITPAIVMEDKILALKDDTAAEISANIATAVGLLICVSAAAAVLAAVLSLYFAEGLTKPIMELTKSVGEIADGNFELTIDIKSSDEIGRLASCVNSMSGDLRSYIANLTKVTADKERIATELNVATKIQESMLPHVFPAFPERQEFDVYASMRPAKEVGGDFYDFFFVDGNIQGGNLLAMVIADVSGKGVPAALFMVIAKTLIRNNAQYGRSPQEVFQAVNSLLCENNDAGMFVTAFMGYLNLTTGEFTYVNAGHNPPLATKEGKFRYLEIKPDFVLAGIEGFSYRQDSMTLERGDTLYLYTDGVTEAVNRTEELFGEPRLLDTVNRHTAAQLKELTVAVRQEIDRFADGAQQADDITMLALKFFGKD